MKRRDVLKSAAHEVESLYRNIEGLKMNPVTVLPFPDRHLLKPVIPNRYNSPTTPDLIRTQLLKILKSNGFVRAERMRRFLEFVVEETLEGRASQLCEYSIGIAVFKRTESFDPGIDPIVRNDARRLRQKLLEYYQRSRGNDDQHVVIDMPKGGYVPVFNAVSHPRASTIGPAYRLTISLIRIADGAEIWRSQCEYSD